jgi:hypothetical protein
MRHLRMAFFGFRVGFIVLDFELGSAQTAKSISETEFKRI